MKIALIGRSEILYDAALALENAGHQIVSIITAKEAPEYTRTITDFEMLAVSLNASFAVGPRIAEHRELLRAAAADIGVSYNYTGLVPSSVVALFPHGILNAHGGDLPRYRGNACQAWAILNGEDRIGLCVHKMVGGELDSGDIIARDYFDLLNSSTVTEAWAWMTKRIPLVFIEALDQLEANPGYVLEAQSKNPEHALRCYPRRPEDGRIDWDRTALEVLRLINASNKPYAGAYCGYEGQRMIIWDAALLEDGEVFCAVSGQVTHVAQGHIVVACGSGKLIIRKVQIEGDVEGAPNRYITSIRKRLT
ncbi:MAG: formyl transferase [Polaromonas sp.]|uniref:methionyl-tRNA formyltransferase n=1 Tax=Polaromonas sp. TaxID=1869339 RepID=UPI001849C565|nr:formyltransferase family protein [Polaromonas sp.]MBA3593217.1 formyl transferase [Polaromonas sp.]